MHEIQRKLLNLVTPNGIGTTTLREIGELIGVSHPQKVKYHLNQLKEAGLVSVHKSEGQIVGITSEVRSGPELASIPIYGSADCGPATLLAEENFEGYLKVSRKILNKKPDSLFALKAVGPSMNRAKLPGGPIESGDFVLIDSSQRAPESGDYVVSVIDGCANIKKLLKEDGRIILTSESTEEYPPIFMHPHDDFLVNGKVVQVVKKPRGGE